MSSMADIPSRGTGLGSSSSFTVGLLHALYGFAQRYASAEVPTFPFNDGLEAQVMPSIEGIVEHARELAGY